MAARNQDERDLLSYSLQPGLRARSGEPLPLVDQAGRPGRRRLAARNITTKTAPRNASPTHCVAVGTGCALQAGAMRLPSRRLLGPSPDEGSADHHAGSDGANDPPRTPQPAELATAPGAPAVAWWRGAAIGAGALVGALGILAVVWLTARTLALLFAAIAIAEAVSPLVIRLERRMARALAIALVYLVLLVVLGLLGWILVPRLVAQAEDLAINAPLLIERGQNLVDEWDPGGQGRIIAGIERNMARFSGALLSLPFALVSSAVQIVLVLFMSAYWLLSRPALGRFTRSLVPEGLHERLESVLDEVGDSIGGYVRGEVIDAALVGALTFAGLSLIGVDYALVLALLAGLGELIPVVGPIVSAVPALAVAFLDSPGQGFATLAFYVVLQQVESNILLPHTMDKQADVPPLLALVALFAGSGIGGILGALIAIPLAGALKVLVVRVVAPAVRRWTGASTEAELSEVPTEPARVPRLALRKGREPAG